MPPTLAQYVLASPNDAEFVAACAAAAEAIVSAYAGTATIPESVRAAAVLEVGANLYGRRVSRSELAAFGDAGALAAPALRPALEAIRPALGIIAPWIPGGFA